MSIEELADFLTGVFNREGFFQTIRPLVYLSQRNEYNVGLLVIGVDDLEAFAATQGREAGAKALKSVAGMISSNLRVSDVVGRYGEKEFIVYLPQMDSSALFKIAELIRNYIELNTMNNLPVTVSIGASQGKLGMDAEKRLEEFIRTAEDNLGKAKGLGGNKAVMSMMEE